MTGAPRLGAPFAAGLLIAGIVVTALIFAGGTGALDRHATLTSVGFVMVFLAGLITIRVDPTWALTGALALSVFSGHWADIGLPVPLDRLAFAAALVSVAMRIPIDREGWPKLRLNALHFLLILSAGWVLISAWRAGMLLSRKTQFEILDAYGFVPWAYLLLAPVVYRTSEQRRVLLAGLTICGAYLGFTAVMEGMNIDALVFPRYITSPDIITHADRARGPFIEAGAMGLALWGCAIASAALFVVTRQRIVKVLCLAVVALCALGVIFTLTRAIWLLAVGSTFLTFICVPALRPRLPLAGLLSIVAVVGAFLLVPGLGDQIERRNNDDASVQSRLNSNRAAVDMFETKPLIGFGFDTFAQKSGPFYSLSPKYPLIGLGDLHQVFLGNLVELGALGALLLYGALGLAVAKGLARFRRATGETMVWKAVLLAYGFSWAIDANFTPLTYPFPNILLWLFAGVAAVELARTRPSPALT